MKVLVIGSGGREHALCSSLVETSSHKIEVLCAPGSAGIADMARCVPIGATDVRSLAGFAEQERVALTIVGGESPLVAGVADAFAARKLKIAAPCAAAARLEASKVYAKEFMRRNDIPTAHFRVADTLALARDLLYSGEFGSDDAPVVVKADGLASGKGVVVARTKREAEESVANLLTVPASVSGGTSRILVEEALEGREASLLLWTDGRDYRLMPPAQDHKRVGEGDTGPNTGGMGAVTAPNILEAYLQESVVREIVEPTLEGLRRERLDYRGVLYIGLMLTAEGARVLEYNVRFGDPEAQALLVRLRSDLAEISEVVAEGRLGTVKVEWADESSACVVLAARGYPGEVEIGARIEGLGRSGGDDKIKVFHSGTLRKDDGSWGTAGGRVLGVATRGETLGAALHECYRRIEGIHWDGMHYRRDIGHALLVQGK